MRSVPTANGALIRNLLSTEGGRLANHCLAEIWVAQAITAGCDPFMQQEPLGSDGYAGEWLLVLSVTGRASPLYPGKLPEGLLDEVFIVLGQLGRLTHDQHLRPWHGNVLLDDSSPRAIAFRIRLVREALYMSAGLFYARCGINPKVGEAIEAGHLSSLSPEQEMLHVISAHYGIPKEWIMHGDAEEIKA
jgi:hypothetical protein